ncbi:DUF3108 domain-containing protein [Colwellia sp. UCD-KL20]|uniref:DUF3108 domain-containing protein n=1 Tax=Colwellia sp. UCD-KL20 TaxID=1917165 RepID=UPI0011788B54|nr:DUF3108 domain-containing protein [Colwellia sp. UCD-KL20]
MLKPLYQCIVLFSVSSFTWAQSAPVLQPPENITQTSHSLIVPFTAEYSIIHKSKQVGTGTRKLEKLTDNTYRYSYKTDIEWLIFDDKRTEESIVTLSNNHVIPTHYKYNREGTGRDKFYEWSYDIANNSASNIKENKTISVTFPENIQDSLSYHLQHRLNLIKNPKQKHFVYPVIKSSGDTRNYVYEYDGEEDLMLPYGLVKTIKLKREVVEKERTTYAWFAPELNYLLVRLYQVKGGTEQFEAQLTSVTVTK